MSEQELPPWLREQVVRLNQLQQNLQGLLMQKQQVEIELVEVEKALEELKKVNADDDVYKTAGPVLIKANKDDVVKDLEEKKELANTRSMVLSKQESRLKENLKEVQAKLDEMVRGAKGAGAGSEAGSTRPRAE
ncbi:MAG: prefoldin subunit beta [Nitrososphaerales archaeon]